MTHNRTDAPRRRTGREHRAGAQRHTGAHRRTGAVAVFVVAAAAVGSHGAPAATAHPAAATPGAPALSVTYSYVDTDRDGQVDRVVLVDPAPGIGTTPRPGVTGRPSRPSAGAANTGPVSSAVARLTTQLAAAKRAAAKAARAAQQARRTATPRAKAAANARKRARTARQRAYARHLAKRAAVAARAAAAANEKSLAATRLVTSLKKAIDRLNRPPRPTPTPTKAAPPDADSGSACANLVRTFRPVPVTSEWQVSCVTSFPGVTTAARYSVLGLTHYDRGSGTARVLVLQSLIGTQLKATFAHELAHAYSLTSMNDAQRAHFLTRIRAAGLTTTSDFFSQSVSYDAMPAEIWARTQARCAGYGSATVSYTEATCTDVTAAIAAR